VAEDKQKLHRKDVMFLKDRGITKKVKNAQDANAKKWILRDSRKIHYRR
jgi:hypothetical protein